MEEKQDMTLSDEDVERIAKRVKDLFMEDFHKDLGKGVWGLAWRAFLIVMVGAAAIGAGVLKLPKLWPE